MFFFSSFFLANKNSFAFTFQALGRWPGRFKRDVISLSFALCCPAGAAAPGRCHRPADEGKVPGFSRSPRGGAPALTVHPGSAGTGAWAKPVPEPQHPRLPAPSPTIRALSRLFPSSLWEKKSGREKLENKKENEGKKPLSRAGVLNCGSAPCPPFRPGGGRGRPGVRSLPGLGKPAGQFLCLDAPAGV